MGTAKDEDFFRHHRELVSRLAPSLPAIAFHTPVAATRYYPKETNPILDLYHEPTLGEWQLSIDRGLTEARYSLLEARGYWQMVLEFRDAQPDRVRALNLTQYFADNAAHRLYSTRERLGQFINHSQKLHFAIESSDKAKGQKSVSFALVLETLKASPEHDQCLVETLDNLSDEKFAFLLTYRHEEGHRLDPLIEDPYYPGLQRLFGELQKDGRGFSLVHTKSSYQGEEVLSTFEEIYRTLLATCVSTVN